MKSQRLKGVDHYVFEDVDEFRNHYGDGAPELIDNWRLATEDDWVIADDGGVVQILRHGGMKHPHDRKNYSLANGWVRTIVGTFPQIKSVKMDTDFDQHPNRYTFSKKDISYEERIRRRKNPTKNERLFAADVAFGRGAVKAAMEHFGIDDLRKARKKALILLKQERIMTEVKKTLSDVLMRHGVDDDYVVGRMKELSDQEEDMNVSFRALRELGIIIDVIGDKNKPKQLLDNGVIGLFQGFGDGMKLPDVKRPEMEIKEDEPTSGGD